MPFGSSCRGDLNEECLICKVPLEYLDADFFFLNELGDIIPIRNLIIGAGNIGIHLIKLFAVLKAIFESCNFFVRFLLDRFNAFKVSTALNVAAVYSLPANVQFQLF